MVERDLPEEASHMPRPVEGSLPLVEIDRPNAADFTLKLGGPGLLVGAEFLLRYGSVEGRKEAVLKILKPAIYLLQLILNQMTSLRHSPQKRLKDGRMNFKMLMSY
jgi:hypothetical protein